MTAIQRVLAVLGLSAVTLAGTGQPGTAITGGEPAGERYPNVALIVFYEGGQRYRCSATLVAPSVLLTAAHCTAGTSGQTLVTFASTVDEEAPTDLPVAGNPELGYTADELGAQGYLYGTAKTHERYSGFTDHSDWHDVGVVLLDTRAEAYSTVAGITPAALPDRVDHLATYAQPLLNSTLFTLVGYGTEVRTAESGSQRPTPMAFPIIRRMTTAPGQKLTPQVLLVNGNPGDTRGGGGICFGDSGGPAFVEEVLVGVASYGYTQNCRYLSGFQRTDIPTVLPWLNQIIADRTGTAAG